MLYHMYFCLSCSFVVQEPAMKRFTNKHLCAVCSNNRWFHIPKKILFAGYFSSFIWLWAAQRVFRSTTSCFLLLFFQLPIHMTEDFHLVCSAVSQRPYAKLLRRRLCPCSFWKLPPGWHQDLGRLASDMQGSLCCCVKALSVVWHDVGLLKV